MSATFCLASIFVPDVIEGTKLSAMCKRLMKHDNQRDESEKSLRNISDLQSFEYAQHDTQMYTHKCTVHVSIGFRLKFSTANPLIISHSINKFQADSISDKRNSNPALQY